MLKQRGRLGCVQLGLRLGLSRMFRGGYLGMALVAIAAGCSKDDLPSADAGANPPPAPIGRLAQPLEVQEWPTPTVVVTNSVSLQDRFELHGDVAAISAATGAVLSSGAELSLGHDSTIFGSVLADTLLLQDRSRVTGSAQYNQKSGNGAVEGGVSSPLSLPLSIQIPTLPIASPSSNHIAVPQGQSLQLAAGAYGVLTVDNGNGQPTTLTLQGGVYHFQSIEVRNDARLLCAAACELRVAANMVVRDRSYLGPQPGAPIGPGNVEVFVGTSNDNPWAWPPAFETNNDSEVKAYVLAPNGTLRFGDRVQVAGKLVGRDVWLGHDANAEGQQLALITQQPQSLSVDVAGAATFSVATQAFEAVYQWQRDGVDIPGAVSTSYTLTSVSSEDSGASFRVRITTAGGVVTSEAAVLTVNACAPADETCDGVDDDCDGVADDDFVTTLTSCGIGACGATGSTSCVSGMVVDSCSPGAPAASDSVCDGVDDDCDGVADEDYVAVSTSCGIGACGATGTTSCVEGVEQDSCVPGAPAPTDATCDGVDDDCDGLVDDDFVATLTSCGIGACGTTGSTSCVSGMVVDSCSPGAPAASDSVCDGIDDDCDGVADEDYVAVSTSCGVGACGATGTTSCVAGAIADSCVPGSAAASDSTCDGVDDDCDGSMDEDYVSVSTTCGVGACGATGSTSCVDGLVEDNCVAGSPAASDVTCDGVDDDCDGVADEDYASVSTSCGVGACAATGSTSCVEGLVEDSCRSEAPASSDSTCDGVDDDCDGVADEDYASVSTSCGVGACGASGATVCVDGAIEDSCVPGAPAVNDPTCDLVDDDCDGAADEDYAPLFTTCGVGACASTGTTECAMGVETDGCMADEPAADDALCDGVDNDCDGNVDEDFVVACSGSAVLTCSNGQTISTECADDSICNGDEVCVGGVCAPGEPLVLDDGNPCTADVCSEEEGVLHLPGSVGSACPDGDLCNGTETCDDTGACVAGAPLELPSAEGPCVAAVGCDAAEGIVFEYEPLGTGCGLGFVCDGEGNCLRQRDDGSLPPPPAPGATYDILASANTLPREPSDGCSLVELKSDRVAMVTGKVFVWNEALGQLTPVAGAVVSAPADCSAGTVSTGPDGTFRFALNGTGRTVLRVNYDEDGNGSFDFLPVERVLTVPWRGSAMAQDVILTRPEPVAGSVSLVAGTVAEDVLITAQTTGDDRDGDGVVAERTPSLLMRAGTVVTAYDESGDVVALNQADLRITEYTVGERGMARMPAPLPESTSYGYAAEFAIEGATEVEFSHPVVLYLDNFLGEEAVRAGGTDHPYRVGMPVPSWYYDRKEAAWLRDPDGIIVRLLGVDDNSPPLALIDADDDGDSDQDDAELLAASGAAADAQELALLAEELSAGRRTAGDELWRVAFVHFSPHDLNWLFDCTSEECGTGGTESDEPLGGSNGDATCKNGSIIDVETRTLKESLPVAGTSYRLTYDSGASYGYEPRRTTRVDRTPPELPAGAYVSDVRETMVMSGREVEGFQRPGAITWDGRDENGHLAFGTHFGGWGVTTTIEVSQPGWLFRRDIVRNLPLRMTVYDAKLLGFGGWSLSSQHYYDAEGDLLFRGDGKQLRSNTLEIVEHMSSVPFNSTYPINGFVPTGDGGAFMAQLGVYRYEPDGTIVRWSGRDGTLASDSPNRVYVARAIDRDIARVELVDGVPTRTALVATELQSSAIAIGPDGILYQLTGSDGSREYLYRYSLDLEPLDGGDPYLAFNERPRGVVQSSMSIYGNTLYIASGQIGRIYKLELGSKTLIRVDSGQAPLGGLTEDFDSLHVDHRGVFFSQDGVIWLIDSEGITRRVYGDAAAPPNSGNNGPARLAGFGDTMMFGFRPDGSIMTLQRQQPALRVIRAARQGVLSVTNESRTEVYEFDAQGHHLVTRDALTGNELRVFEYEDGLLSAVVEDGRITRIDRSVPGQVRIVAATGQTTTILLDQQSYARQVIDAAGYPTDLAMSASGLLTEMKDASGYVHKYGYDARGQLQSDETVGVGEQTLSGYAMTTVRHTNGEGEASLYSISQDATVNHFSRTVTNTDGSSVTVERDNTLQRVTTTSDGTTVTERFRPDPELVAPAVVYGLTTLPSGLSRESIRDVTVQGNVRTERMTVNGQSFVAVRDRNLRTVETTSPAGRTTYTLLDSRSRPLEVRLGNLASTRFAYDNMGRLVSLSQGSGSDERVSTFEYFDDDSGLPEAGYLMAVSDPLGQFADFARDGLGRATSVTTGSQTTRLAYTPTGKVASLRTATGAEHGHSYNATGAVAVYASPATEATSSSTSYSYDKASRLVETGLPGDTHVRIERERGNVAFPERNGRVRAISGEGSAGTEAFVVDYVYADELDCSGSESCPEQGPPGQLSMITRGDVTTSLVWDGFLPVAEAHSIADTSASGLLPSRVSLSLNANFLPRSDGVTVGDETFTGSYDYDADATLTCAGAGSGTCDAATGTVYAFDTTEGHGLLQSTRSGLVEEKFGYNSFGELATRTVEVEGVAVRSTVYHSESAPRDGLGRTTRLSTTRGTSTTVVNYGFDIHGQLKTVERDGNTVVNIYDANGNRLCQVSPPATECPVPAVYDSQDRLLSYGATAYSYTDRGTLYQRLGPAGLETFTYDAVGNLTRRDGDGMPTVEYTIDAQGRRVGKRLGGVLVKQYVWSNALRIVAETEGDGTTTQRFIYGNDVNVPDIIVRRDADGQRLYRVVTDHLGSPVYVVNIVEPGDVLLDAEYDEWGRVLSYTSSTGAWPIPFGFAGGLYDEDTGLVRFGTRDYDPTIGRWTAKDPIRWEGGQTNLYVYAGNSPVELSDPLGLGVDSEQEPSGDEESSCENGDDGEGAGDSECFGDCMDKQGTPFVLGAMGLSSPAVSVPKVGRGRRIARYSGGSRFTNMLSAGRASGVLGRGARVIGRRLNPAANLIFAFGGGYLAASALICAAECS